MAPSHPTAPCPAAHKWLCQVVLSPALELPVSFMQCQSLLERKSLRAGAGAGTVSGGKALLYKTQSQSQPHCPSLGTAPMAVPEPQLHLPDCVAATTTPAATASSSGCPCLQTAAEVLTLLINQPPTVGLLLVISMRPSFRLPHQCHWHSGDGTSKTLRQNKKEWERSTVQRFWV